MAFGSFDKSEEIEANAEINMVPFIDVMLVLLIIFMITAPLMTQAIKVDLPQESAEPQRQESTPVRISIDANGAIYVNDALTSADALSKRLAPFSADSEVHLRADKQARYETVAHVLAAAADAGLNKVGFVTEPRQ